MKKLIFKYQILGVSPNLLPGGGNTHRGGAPWVVSPSTTIDKAMRQFGMYTMLLSVLFFFLFLANVSAQKGDLKLLDWKQKSQLVVKEVVNLLLLHPAGLINK